MRFYLGSFFRAGVTAFIFTTIISVAGTIYVKHDATGTGDGSSWTNAYTDLQPAIDAAVAGDEVWVAAGTYKPTSWPNGGSSDRERHFSLKNGVAVYGGFAGTETLLAERDIAANETICSGDFNGDDVVTGSGATLAITNNEENAFSVFFHIGVSLDASAELDGVTISGGSGTENNGGGMYNNECSPTLINCTFSGNDVGVDGGGMYNYYSNPVLTNCRFIGNRVGHFGGGIYNDSSSPTLTGSTFDGNNAVSGAGIYNKSGSSNLTDCTFAENDSGSFGGGMYLSLIHI